MENINKAFKYDSDPFCLENAMTIIRLICIKNGATEGNPVKIGNVEFWLDNVDSEDEINNKKSLCWSIPTNQWDINTVQPNINRLIAPHMDCLEFGMNNKIRIKD